jgi:hypothetical protein
VGAAVPLALRDGVRLALELPVCERVGCNEVETVAEPLDVNVTLPLPLVLPLRVREALPLSEPEAVLDTDAEADRDGENEACRELLNEGVALRDPEVETLAEAVWVLLPLSVALLVRLSLLLPVWLLLELPDALTDADEETELLTDAPADRLAVCDEVPEGDGCNDWVTEDDGEVEGDPLAVTVAVCKSRRQARNKVLIACDDCNSENQKQKSRSRSKRSKRSQSAARLRNCCTSKLHHGCASVERPSTPPSPQQTPAADTPRWPTKTAIVTRTPFRCPMRCWKGSR